MSKSLVILGAFALLPSLPGPARPAEAFDAVPPKSFPNAQQPQLVVSPAGKVYLAFGSGGDVYCAASADGKAFSAPVKVGSAGALALGMRRGPRVAATDKAVVVTAIGGKQGRGRDEDLLAWRSADGGKTWKGPVTVNTVRSSAREGLHHMAAAPDGTVYCTWLDLRAKRTEVYGAASTDGGATWKGEGLVYKSPDGSVCECCQPQAAYDADGTLHVMWRNQLQGARDMYVASSKDHGKTFTKAAKLGRGTWPLKACPMDGGGLAPGGKAGLVTVWRRDKEVFRAMSGKAEELLGKGEQPWAAAGPGGAYLVWVTARPGAVLLLRPGKDKPEKLAERGWDPVVAGPPGKKGPVVAAWEEGRAGAKRVRAVVLSAGG